jgi:hypothetical protein
MNNGFTTVKVDGQEVGLWFGMPAIVEMMDKTMPTDASTSLLYTAELLFAGYKNNCMVERVQPSLTFKPFYELVENSFLDEQKTAELNAIVQVFTESKFVKAGKEQLEKASVELTKKKNGHQTKSKHSATDS